MIKVYLNVRTEDVSKVKALGATYDSKKEKWCISPKKSWLFTEYEIDENSILHAYYCNVTAGLHKISQLLASKNVNIPFTNCIYLEKLLLQYNPKNINYEIIDYFVIRYCKENILSKTRMLYYKSKNKNYEEWFCYRQCLQNLFGLYNKDNNYRKSICKAFRNSITNTKRLEYIHEHDNKECTLCHSLTDIQVDHKDFSFQEIFDTFITINNINIQEIILSKSRYQIINNLELRKKWITYHDSIVQYRYLCKQCNVTINDGGYRFLKK
jgi:hypothetical protein